MVATMSSAGAKGGLANHKKKWPPGQSYGQGIS